MATEKPLILLFDANALIHRGYHALPPLSLARTGEPVGAVYGFASMLLKCLADFQPAYAAAAFDRAAPTFRHVQFEAYKAQRPKMADDLGSQFRRVRELLAAIRIPIYELDGFEADDLLGALAKQARAAGLEVIVVTGDADTMQLVEPGVRVLMPRKGFSDTALHDEAAVKERYGVRPDQIADLKALKGDPSDNIPGVPGIGDKTAAKLLEEFGSLDELYRRLDEVKPARVQEALRANAEAAHSSRELTTIVRDLPIALDIETSRSGQYDRQAVLDLFRELEFRSLVDRLPANGRLTAPAPDPTEPPGRTPPAAAPKPAQLSLFGDSPSLIAVASRPAGGVLVPVGSRYQVVNTLAALDALVARIGAAPELAIDLETTNLDAVQAELVGVALCLEPGEAFYVPVGHRADEAAQLPASVVLDRLRAPLMSERLVKIAHNGKYDLTVLANYDLVVRNFAFDTMVAAYVLGEKALSLKDLAFAKLGLEMTPIAELIGTGAKQISMAQTLVSVAADYAASQVDVTLRLRRLLEPDIRERGLWPLFAEIEMPLVPVLVAMERAGVLLDTDGLRAMSRELGQKLGELEQEIYRAIGHQFNVNSTQQLSQVLFQQLRLPAGRRTSAGYSTEQAVLEGLRGTHPVVDLILEYRQLKKLKSTYVDTLPALINPTTGRVHTSFNQTVVTTGRLSSSNPNLQNIPIRTELGREIRRAFIAAPGKKLLSADYSQVELRVLAHLSQEPGLLQAFARDEDIHRTTASRVFGTPLSEVTSNQRDIAKRINFATIYGVSDFGLAQATGVSRREAAERISTYFETHPRVRAYLDRTKAQARREGYVETLLGRRRYIPEIHSPNYTVQSGAERMAINAPVQGSASDIIKIAMIRLHREVERQGFQAHMVLQVHDELVFEAPEAEIPELARLVKATMEHAYPLDVPLKVDVSAGPNWDELEPVDRRMTDDG